MRNRIRLVAIVLSVLGSSSVASAQQGAQSAPPPTPPVGGPSPAAAPPSAAAPPPPPPSTPLEVLKPGEPLTPQPVVTPSATAGAKDASNPSATMGLGGGPPAKGPPKEDPNAAEQQRWFRPFMLLLADAQAFLGPGLGDYRRTDGTGPYNGFAIPLARLGARGVVNDRFRYEVFLDTGGSNSRGPLQTPLFLGGFNNAWVGYEVVKEYLDIRLGQMAPAIGREQLVIPDFGWDFVRQSRTSLLVSNGGKDIGIMAHGVAGPLVYAAGIYNGEGRNFAPVDRTGNAVARVGFRINEQGEGPRAELGLSGSYGSVDPRSSQNQPTALGVSTARGYQFWDPNYTVQNLAAPTQVRLFRSGAERQVGVDGLVQLGDLELSAEAFLVDLGRRESALNALNAEETLRAGAMRGVSWYAGANYWLHNGKMWRDARFYGWLEAAKAVKKIAPPKFDPAVAVRARFEQSLLSYDSIAHSPETVDRGMTDQYGTRITANTIQTALAVWWTKRILVQAEYGFNWFPADVVTDPASRGRRLDNQALAPGAVVRGERGTTPAPNIPADTTYGDPQWFRPIDLGARTLHELTLRVAVSFP